MTEDNSPSEPDSDDSAPARERTTPIDADAAFDLLADAERRAILGYLRSDADGTATVDELIDAVRRREADGDRAAVRVHHEHLPKLVDAGVADYDRRSETVRYWGNSFLEALLDAGRADEATAAAGGGAAESANSEAE